MLLNELIIGVYLLGLVLQTLQISVVFQARVEVLYMYRRLLCHVLLQVLRVHHQVPEILWNVPLRDTHGLQLDQLIRHHFLESEDLTTGHEALQLGFFGLTLAFVLSRALIR